MDTLLQQLLASATSSESIRPTLDALVNDSSPPLPFTGSLTLVDRHQSTTVATGNNIACSRTTPSTNYTEEMFTHQDTFVVTFTVHDFAGGPVHIGILPAGPNLSTARSNCGSKEIPSSSSFVVAPDGTMQLIIKSRTICSGTWDAANAASHGAKLAVQWRAGRTTLSVNGTPWNVPSSTSPCMRGHYRLGVSLTTAGQRAQLQLDSFELGSSRVTKGAVLRFIREDHIDLHDDNRSAVVARDGNRFVTTDALLAPGCTAFSVQLRVTNSKKSPVWFGVVPSRILDDEISTMNPWECEGAVMARIDNGTGTLLHDGRAIQRCNYDGRDPVGIRLIVTDETTVVVQVDNERLAPPYLKATKLTEPFRVVALFTRADQSAEIGDEDDVTAEIESTIFKNEIFHDFFSFESPCTVMTNYADGRGFSYNGYGWGTNFSSQAFSSEDRFAVEMTPDDLCGGRMYLGFMSTDVEGQTVMNELCGSTTLQPSAACVIEPRRVGVFYQDTLLPQAFDVSVLPRNVVRFEWDRGAVRFFVNGTALDCSELPVFERGTFRLGVSVVKPGQRAQISTTPLAAQELPSERNSDDGSSVSEFTAYVDRSLEAAEKAARAAAAGDATELERLIKRNPEVVSWPDPSGVMPLHAAARAGHEASVRLLLAYGADPHAVQWRTCLPLGLPWSVLGRATAS